MQIPSPFDLSSNESTMLSLQVSLLHPGPDSKLTCITIPRACVLCVLWTRLCSVHTTQPSDLRLIPAQSHLDLPPYRPRLEDGRIGAGFLLPLRFLFSPSAVQLQANGDGHVKRPRWSQTGRRDSSRSCVDVLAGMSQISLLPQAITFPNRFSVP